MEAGQNVNSQSIQSREIVELFRKLLDESGYNLDQAAGNTSFLIPEGFDDEFASDLRRLLQLLKKTYREDVNVLEVLNEVDKGEHSDKFIATLSRFLEFTIQPVKETAFIREFTLEQFNKIVEYCCLHCIISNDPVRTDGLWEEKQLQVVRKLILTVSELIVFQNYSKQYVLDQINDMFCLAESYGEILWNIVKANEDRIWKYLMAMRSERIEDKLNLLLELIQSNR